MDQKEFREFGRAAIDYIADYYENIRDKEVLPSVQPGYLQHLIPSEVPEKGESWKEIIKDMDRVIMPGVTHWQSPHFHAYYPTASSYPGIVGEIMCAGIACVGFSWICGPACTELEVAMMNWLGKMLDLPKEFLNCSEGPGGGVLQGSASESTFVGLLAAKERMVKYYQSLHPEMDEQTIKSKLVCYSSEHSNSSVEKAGMLGSTPMRLLPTDDNCRLRGKTLLEAIEKDKKAGFIPFYVVATLGTTGTCAFDDIEEIGPICQKDNIWLHIDAAYAGAALACPEYRHLMPGIHWADSFNFNLHKWMLTNFDCSAMWVKNAKYLVEAFNVNRIYLKHQHEGRAPDYRHWQIPLGRRFRSLKIWFVMRIYGAEGIRNYLRTQVSHAQHFANSMKSDPHFQVVTEVLGLVCFRLKGPDSRTQKLLDKLMERKLIYVIPATFRGELIIRFALCTQATQRRDIDFAWNEIQNQAHLVLAEENFSLNGAEDILAKVMNEKCKIKAVDSVSNNNEAAKEKTK